MYDTAAEAERRLMGTIVGFDGRPVQVDHVRTRDGGVEIGVKEFPFRDRDELTFYPQDDKRFKRFSTVPLGFINFFSRQGGNNAAFAERQPVRRTKQGLSSESFLCTTLTGWRYSWAEVFQSDAFNEMVQGIYPTLDEAHEHLIPGSAIGISRTFAVKMTESGYRVLYHKREEIGLFVRGTLNLRPDRQYLMETIIEAPYLPDTVELL